MKTTIVVKFGGTSVSTVKSWKTIARVVKKHLKEVDRVIVVVSAIAGVSDTLEELAQTSDPAHRRLLLDTVEDRHYQLIEALNITTSIRLGRLLSLLNISAEVKPVGDPARYADIMSFGERASSSIGEAFLRSQQIPMTLLSANRLLLATDDGYTDTSCIFSPILEEQKFLVEGKRRVMITEGFIARNQNDNTVLLGRGGSDTSATLIASGVKAKRCEIWSNVPGFYSTDPRTVAEAKLIRKLSYEEAQEIALMGAKVLHPRAIAPLLAEQIELRLCSTDDYRVKGTVISGQVQTDDAMIKAISVKDKILLLQMASLQMWRQAGFLADIFACFKRHRLSVDLVATSEATVCVSLDEGMAELQQRLDRLLADLSNFCRVIQIPSCLAISLVGRNIRSILPKISKILTLFDNQIVHLVSQSANDLSVTFVVDRQRGARLVQRMHRLLFENGTNIDIFGSSWSKLRKKQQPRHLPGWWVYRRQRLLSMMKKHEMLYVYDLATVDKALQKLTSIEAVDRIFYAVKANSCRQLLMFLANKGCGLECVSQGELVHLEQTQLTSAEILFTPNFCQKDEYSYALQRRYQVTVDNLYVLEKWGDLWQGQEIFLRIDPGSGRGHHRHVTTGGIRSKFGIARSDIVKAKEIAKRYAIKIKGLHVHSGSGILTSDDWRWRAEVLAEMLDELPEVEIFNLGGGFGVPEHPRDQQLSIDAVAESLAEIKRKLSGIDLWIEPGRYLVAEAGVLLAKVTQTKHKDGVKFVGLTTGMNSLIRPALYDSYHQIFNLSRLDDEQQETVDIVGPICESADNFGNARQLPPCQEGDVLLIANSGAYGATMSSSYNLRPPADELILE